MEEQEEAKFLDVNMVDIPDEEISFSSSQNFCVCVVDIVNSTEIILRMNNPFKVRKYILTFINSMAAIARNHGATIVKNVGDALIFYFPETSDSQNKDSFKKAFDCFSAMIDALPIVNRVLRQEGMPSIGYRISADYGRVEVAKSTTSREDDLFGSTMSLCIKINSMASRNGTVIGGDLYRITTSLHLEKHGYRFNEIGPCATGLKFPYPVYEVIRTSKDVSNPFRRIFKRKPEDGYSLKSTSERKDLSKIMIIDDDLSVLSLCKTFLGAAKLNVETFSTAEEALGKLAFRDAGYYSLVIIDIRLALINGLEFYEKLRMANPYTKMLFLSSPDSVQDLIRILPNVKTQNILRKPVDVEDFVKTVVDLVS